MSQTQIIVLHGHQLSAGHHYAVALIMQRCNELRHYCDTLDAALKAKRAHLLQTHQLLLCLGQVRQRRASTNPNTHMDTFFSEQNVFFHPARPKLGVMTARICWPISWWISCSLKREPRLLCRILRNSWRRRHQC